MKRQIILLLILSLITIVIKAQEKKVKPEERAQNQTELLTKELNLSQEQSLKIYDINLNHFINIEKIKNAGLSQEEQKKQIKELLQKRRNEFKKVLSKEQMAKLKELLKKMKELKAN